MDQKFGTGIDEAVDFIKQNTLPTEKIGVFPNSGILLFATSRSSASPVVQYLTGASVSPEDQNRIIQDFEKSKTNWIFLESASQREFAQ